MAGPSYDIFDPYGGPRAGYVAMVSEVQHLLEAGGARIVQLASQPPEAAPRERAGDKK
jgi:hypothetical protein